MLTMTAKQKQDFESRFFDQLAEEFKSFKNKLDIVSDKVDNNTLETRAARQEARAAAQKAAEVGEMVKVLDGAVFPRKPINPWYKDEKVIKIILWIIVSGIVIFAAINNIKLPSTT